MNGASELTNRKLGVGTPLNFPFVHADFHDAFSLMMMTAIMNGLQMEYLRHGNGPVDALRNLLTVSARQTGCSHIIMVDADMVYPPDTLVKLMPQVTKDRPVVGALTFRRYIPFDPLMFRGRPGAYEPVEEWEDGELVEVDATGTGCLMFHASVFDIINPPWFEFTATDKGKVIGEDIGFCRKLREVGIPVYVDTSIETVHLSTLGVNKGFWKLWKVVEAARKEAAEELKNSKE